MRKDDDKEEGKTTTPHGNSPHDSSNHEEGFTSNEDVEALR